MKCWVDNVFVFAVFQRLSTSYHRLLAAIVPAEKSAERLLAPPQPHDDSHLPFLSRCVAQHLPGGMPLKLFTFVIVGADTFLDVHFMFFIRLVIPLPLHCLTSHPGRAPLRSVLLRAWGQWCSPLAPPTAPFAFPHSFLTIASPQIKSLQLEMGDKASFEACLPPRQSR